MPLLRFLVLATAATAGALLAPSTVAAHGLHADVTVADTIKVVVYFDDDMPAESADVRVTDAAGAEVLAGQTDERGVCTFPRPAPGAYTLRAKSTGHAAKVEFRVDGEPDAAPAVPAVYTGWRMNRAVGLISGLVLLLGLSIACKFFFRRRRG